MNCTSPVFFINPLFKRWATGVTSYVMDGVTYGVDLFSDYRQFRNYFLNFRKRTFGYDSEGKFFSQYDEQTDIHLAENTFAVLEDRRIVPVYLRVPCGKCEACQVHKYSDLRSRLLLESVSHPGKQHVFLTLTYDDAHLPSKGVCRKDVSGFLKRLRSNLGYSSYDNTFRPFYVSEYGTDPNGTHRAHYHLLLFGMDFSKKASIINFRLQLKKSWKFGFSHFEFARDNQACAAYVSKYIIKSVKREDNVPLGKNPNFWSGPCSQDGGLGSLMLDYIKENFDYTKDTHVLVKTPTGTQKIRVPKFILDKIEPPASRIVTKKIFDLYGQCLTHYAVLSRLSKAVSGSMDGIVDPSYIGQFIESHAPSDYYDDCRSEPSRILTSVDPNSLIDLSEIGSSSGGTTQDR